MWCDDLRPPLSWVGSDDPKERGAVLMYERRHFFVDGCERLPTSLEAVEELLVNAHEAFSNIVSIELCSFEHVGSQPDVRKF